MFKQRIINLTVRFASLVMATSSAGLMAGSAGPVAASPAHACSGGSSGGGC